MYQYRWVEIDQPLTEKELNALGEQGYRVVPGIVVTRRNPDGNNGNHLLMELQKP